MKTSFILPAGFAAFASATSSWCKPSSQLATFDNLTALPGVSEANPVGTYKGITYRGLNVLEQGVGAVQTRVIPESEPNVAANSITNNILEEQPALIAAGTGNCYSFDLKYLYFGCVVDSVESAVGVPEECTISFTAFKKGSSVAFQTVNYQFNPATAVTSAMVKAKFTST